MMGRLENNDIIFISNNTISENISSDKSPMIIGDNLISTQINQQKGEVIGAEVHRF